MLAAMQAGRNSIGVDIDSAYCRMAAIRLRNENQTLTGSARLEFLGAPVAEEDTAVLHEEQALYKRIPAASLRG